MRQTLARGAPLGSYGAPRPHLRLHRMDLLGTHCSPPRSSACLLGLSKGGFFGLGMMALPLMAITVPPMQAAAILLPTVLAQDALTIWAYRRDWSAWNLKIMIPAWRRDRDRDPARGVAVRHPYPAGDRADRFRLRAAALARQAFRTPGRARQCGDRRRLRGARRPCWPMPAGRPGRSICCRRGSTSSPGHADHAVCRQQPHEDSAYGAIGQLTFDNLAVGSALRRRR